MDTNEEQSREREASKIDIYTRGEASQLILRHIPRNTPFTRTRISRDDTDREGERQKFAYIHEITTLTTELNDFMMKNQTNQPILIMTIFRCHDNSWERPFYAAL